MGTPYTAYTCRPPIAANAPCNKHFTDVCVPGHLCWGPKGSTTCQRVALGGEGDSCTVEASTSEMIRLCDPWKGWTCFPNDASPMGTCGAGGGSGEPSLRIFDEAACIRGFAPTGPDYRCEPLRPTGEECLGGIECASGFCQAGTCREVSCY